MKRLLVVIILAGVLGVEGSAAGQEPAVLNVNQQISIRAEDVTLKRFFELWDQATGMQSNVPPQSANSKLSIHIAGLNVNDALWKIFDGQPFGYVQIDGHLIIVAISDSNSVAEPQSVDNDATQVTEQPVLPEIGSPPPQPPPQQRFIPTPFGPILSSPTNRQFTQLPPVVGAPPAPPFFAPELPTIPPAGAANGPLENQLFGPLPIYQNPN